MTKGFSYFCVAWDVLKSVPVYGSLQIAGVVSSLTARAGAPTAVMSSGMSRSTTDPAPMVARFPIRVPGRTVEPIPRKASHPTITFPANALLGPICAPFPIQQSWSTPALVLMIAPSPIRADALITAPAMMAIPRPSTAVGETTAFGLIALMSSNPISKTWARSFNRKRLSPIAMKAFFVPFSNTARQRSIRAEDWHISQNETLSTQARTSGDLVFPFGLDEFNHDLGMSARSDDDDRLRVHQPMCAIRVFFRRRCPRREIARASAVMIRESRKIALRSGRLTSSADLVRESSTIASGGEGLDSFPDIIRSLLLSPYRMLDGGETVTHAFQQIEEVP
jgi:hypothetical protein